MAANLGIAADSAASWASWKEEMTQRAAADEVRDQTHSDALDDLDWLSLGREDPKRAIRAIILHGVPQHLRPTLWLEWSGGRRRKQCAGAGYYRSLVQRLKLFCVDDSSNSASESSTWQAVGRDALILSCIKADIKRTFSKSSDHPAPFLFASGAGAGRGLACLWYVLVGFAHEFPAIGYLQGMSYVAASLMMSMRGSVSASSDYNAEQESKCAQDDFGDEYDTSDSDDEFQPVDFDSFQDAQTLPPDTATKRRTRYPPVPSTPLSFYTPPSPSTDLSVAAAAIAAPLELPDYSSTDQDPGYCFGGTLFAGPSSPSGAADGEGKVRMPNYGGGGGQRQPSDSSQSASTAKNRFESEACAEDYAGMNPRKSRTVPGSPLKWLALAPFGCYQGSEGGCTGGNGVGNQQPLQRNVYPWRQSLEQPKLPPGTQTDEARRKRAQKVTLAGRAYTKAYNPRPGSDNAAATAATATAAAATTAAATTAATAAYESERAMLALQEDSFWLLCSLCGEQLRAYYQLGGGADSAGGLREESKVMGVLVDRLLPDLGELLREVRVEFFSYTILIHVPHHTLGASRILLIHYTHTCPSPYTRCE
jgi:hypothetical protein